MKNIVLIGFMGVGKGTLAREMCRQSKLMTIDTDALIETMENRKIKEIFASEGEKYFRDQEKRVAKWLQKSVKNTIISTGGGFFNVKNLNDIGTVVLLDSSFDAIYQRILEHPQAKKKLAKRPLFQSIDKAKELYKKRVPLYREKADLIINVEGKDEVEVAEELFKLLKF